VGASIKIDGVRTDEASQREEVELAAAIVVWLVASGAFAFYVSKFSSYNKTGARSPRWS